MQERLLPIKKMIKVILWVFAIIIVVALIAGLIEVNREQVYYETTKIDQHIDISNMTFAELDRVIQSDYSIYCEGMQLVEATVEIQYHEDAILQGEANLIYYRYVDESMEGGNVETNECCFDLTKNTIVSVEHWHGSGRSIMVSDQAIDENILKTQLEQYAYHAAELADLQTSGIYTLRADCVNSWMNVTLHAKNDNLLLYQEKLIQWPENDQFDERIFTTDEQ